MEKSNGVKNRFRLFAIIVLVLAIVAGTFVAVYNYKNKKILAKIIDVDGKLIEQSVLLNAKRNEDGTYSLELPNVVNSFVVDSFYTESDERILFDGEEPEVNLAENTEGEETQDSEKTNDNETTSQTETVENIENNAEYKEEYVNKTITLTLTEEQLEDEEISLKAQYDKKIVEYSRKTNSNNSNTTTISEEEKERLKNLAIQKIEEAKKSNQNVVTNYGEEKSQNTTQYTLYNKRYVYDDKIVVTGYAFRDTEFKVEEIELTEEEKELTSAKKVEKKFKVSVNETENLQRQNSLATGEPITVETINEENNILFYGNVDATADKYIETKKFGLISSDTEIYISETEAEEEKQDEEKEQQEGEIDENTPIEEIQIDETKATGKAVDITYNRAEGEILKAGQGIWVYLNATTSELPTSIGSWPFQSPQYFRYVWTGVGGTPDWSYAAYDNNIQWTSTGTSRRFIVVYPPYDWTPGQYTLWVQFGYRQQAVPQFGIPENFTGYNGAAPIQSSRTFMIDTVGPTVSHSVEWISREWLCSWS